MYPARCPSPHCRCTFTSDRRDSITCPSCGTAAILLLDVGMTADTAPDIPTPRSDLPTTVDGPVEPGPISGSAPITLPDRAHPAATLPATVGRFRVRGKLGAGAFGDVYRAHDPQLDREVALKVARPGTFDSPDRVGRFLREARAAANLRHPNIVPVYDSGHDGERHYIASGFIDGRTLEAEIEEAEGRPLELRRAATVVRKLAEALGYAHKQGVVHRDVKPANVLVDRAGEPSLTDFGLAVRAGDEAVKTTDGRVMGTPAYMSPEQAAGRSAEATAASDQYALGVILYELATGRRPFEGPVEVVLVQQIQVEPRRPRSENRAIPADLETVILKCLEKEPGRRYADCEALAEDLRRFLDGEPVKARRIGPAERLARWAKRNPVVASSVSFGVLALLIGAAVALWQADVARGEAKNAKDAADDALTKKTLADQKTGEAMIAAKRADDNKQLADREAAAASTKAKENQRLLDLSLLRQAELQWKNGQEELAQETLERVSPENRCAVWRFLTNQLEGALFTLRGHTGTVRDVKWSPDGSRLATASEDTTVQVWDTRTGTAIVTLRGHESTVNAVAWHPDGTKLATASSDKTVRVWDARTGHPSGPPRSSLSPVQNVAWSPDGIHLAMVTSQPSAELLVWAANTGQIVFRLKTKASRVVWSPDGARLALGLYNGTYQHSTGHVQIIDASTGAVRQTLPHQAGVVQVEWSPDGKLLATCEAVREDRSRTAPQPGRAAVAAGTVRVWDAGSGESVRVIEEGGSATWTPGGEWLVASNVLWSARSGELVRDLADRPLPVGGEGLSPNRQLRAVRAGLAVRIRGARVAMPAAVIGQVGSATNAVWSPDGTAIATTEWRTGQPGHIRVWNSRTGLPIMETALPAGAGRVAWSPDGKKLATSEDDSMARFQHRVCIRDAHTGKVECELRGPFGVVMSLAWSPDGTHVATADYESETLDTFASQVRVWNARTGAMQFEVAAPTAKVFRVAWSPDGTRLAAAGGEKEEFQLGRVRVWDVRTHAITLELTGHVRRIVDVAWSPDGTHLATCAWDNSAAVWDARTGQLLVRLKGHSDIVNGVAWSHDSTRLATASGNRGGAGGVRIWDVVTGQSLIELPTTGGWVNEVSWSPDGTGLLATISEGGTGRRAVHVWDLRAKPPQLAFSNPAAVMGKWQWSPDGSRVAAQGDSAVRVWAVASRQPLFDLVGHKNLVNIFAWSPNGNLIATGSEDRTVAIWDAKTGHRRAILEGYASSLVWSPDSTRLATSSSTESASVWDAGTGQLVTVITNGLAGIGKMTWTPDSTRLITDYYGVFTYWDPRTGARLSTEKKPRGLPERQPGTPVSPDGEWILEAERDNTRLVLRRLRHQPLDPERLLWLTRPDPFEYALDLAAAEKARDDFAARTYRSLEARAAGVIALDRGDLDRAWQQFIVSAALRPTPRRLPALGPSRGPVRPKRRVSRRLSS